MARIPCPECKRQISETADSCPKCGYKLTPEEAAKIKQKNQAIQMGCAILLVVVSIPILISIAPDCSSSHQRKPTSTSTYSSQPQRPKVIETPQEQNTENNAWIGTWSLESSDSEPTKTSMERQFRSSGLSDIFLSWYWTFYANGQFKSEIRQDTGEGTFRTTIYGTYNVSNNRYTYRATRANASIGSTTLPIPIGGDIQRGTWSIEGQLLTLKSNDITVFRRK